ncbi:hypothetical protein pb186bvf_016457, partial [Paramecium bursaria]
KQKLGSQVKFIQIKKTLKFCNLSQQNFQLIQRK